MNSGRTTTAISRPPRFDPSASAAYVLFAAVITPFAGAAAIRNAQG